MGQISRLQTVLNNKIVTAPVEWQDVTVKATFDNDSQQANISTSDFTLVLEAREEIEKWINDGFIFEGIPLDLQITKGSERYELFKGYLNTPSVELINFKAGSTSPVKIRGNIEKSNGLNQLDERLSAITYGFLLNENVIKSSDFVTVNYVVEKPINATEIAVLSLTAYLMIKEVADAAVRINDRIATIAGILIAGATGFAGAALAQGFFLLAEIAYVIVMLVQLKRLMQSLIEQFISPVRRHKAMQIKTLLSKACEYLGYGFIHNIDELNESVYLPSTNAEGEPIEIGIPKPNDFGYTPSEMFQLVIDMFHAKVAIIDGNVHLRWVDDPFWIKTSTYVLPPVKLEEKRFNTEDLNSSISVSYTTDLSDTWTINNYEGTSALLTQRAKVVRNQSNVLTKNYDRIQLPVALGNRKEKLNSLEKLAKTVAGLVDDAVNTLGGNSNFAGAIQNRVGMLKISSAQHTVAKVLVMNGRNLSARNKDKIGARALVEKYHIEKSFIHDNFKRQRAVYEGVRIPFNLTDFLKLTNNSYFRTQDGKVGKFTSVDWNIASDVATVDFWIREVYTKNLAQQIIEPE